MAPELDSQEETGELPPIHPGEISALGASAMGDLAYRGLQEILHQGQDEEEETDLGDEDHS